jgi:CheY-like chemotaxis protein
VQVRVSDTGTGIPAEAADRVFDPFFTTKRSGKGTGLGLALVQHIMSLHKGSVKVEKTGPSGTTFLMEFPECEALEVDRDTRWMLSTRIKTRLLLLDDDAKMRDVLKVFLRDFGYEVSEASTVEEAAAELQKYRDVCRVVVMDWKLGARRPQDVVRRLRGIRNDLLIIVVSGYGEDTQAMKRLDIRRWFTKPFDKNLLDTEIQRALYLARRTPPGQSR